MLAVFLTILGVWLAITVAAIVLIPGDPKSVEKRFVSTRFCAYCGKETSTDSQDCEHCHQQLVCEIPGQAHHNHAQPV